MKTIQDESEEKILFDLEAILEKSIPEVLANNYNSLVLKAQDRIKGDLA
jgi:hypothetical protein